MPMFYIEIIYVINIFVTLIYSIVYIIYYEYKKIEMRLWLK